MQKLKIGVFDSGVGGLSVVNAIAKALPQTEVIFRNDQAHMPYGTKTVDEIYELTKPILQDLIAKGCQVLVIACNTVTTNLITRFREEITVPLVGMEPMVKPAAAASKTKIICVCATPRTLSSERYHWLKTQYAKGVQIIEPDCSDWSTMIETKKVDRSRISAIVEDAMRSEADQVVLGCTHFHWIEDLIRELVAGRAVVMQPEIPVIDQLKRVIKKLP